MQNSKVKSQNDGNNFAFCILHFDFERKRTGFTLIETVVALALLSLALAGPVTLATRGIFNTRFSKNKLTAAQLAAEGVEIIRQKRDSNIMAGNDWATSSCDGTSNCNSLYLCAPGSTCSYQGDVAGAWIVCTSLCTPPSTPPPLGYNSSTGLYTQGCSTNCTSFTRIITVDRSIGNEQIKLLAGTATITGDNRMRITSTVTWQDNIGPQSLTLTQILYNWR